MADPEIKLPRERSDEENSLSNSELEKAEIEKQPLSDASSHAGLDDSFGPQAEIVWHYLTFESDLPSPVHLSQRTVSPIDARPSPPQCPDLKKYTSPFLWSPTRKNFTVLMSCAATIASAVTSGSYAAGEPQMMQKWHISETAASVGITSFTVGFGIAPMALASFSEICGRRPVLVSTGVLYVIFQLICGLTPTFAGMIVARFFVGCTSSTFSTMIGGIVSDIYHAKDRNTAMSLFAGSALLGTGLGPLIAGFIGQRSTYTWIFYSQTISCTALMAILILFFKETRGSVLLSRKAKILNKWYEQLESEGYYGMMIPCDSDSDKKAPQRIRWKVKSDEERESIAIMISTSLYRPFHLLFTEPVVFFFSLWISFSWGVLYLLFSAVPLVFQSVYAFNLEQADAVFAAVSVAAILSTIINLLQDKLARHYLSNRQAFLDSPEGRLLFCCAQSALLPIGCFWFGWTSFAHIPWIVPALAVGCVTMGIFCIYLAVFNYLADSYGRYASSALAAQSCCRNLLAGAFPLFTPQMYRALTYQGAGSLLGGVAALLTLVPTILVIYGPRIRARSKLCREMMEQ